MPNYQLSKIYRIEPNNSECDGDVYYGSSCEPYLSRRMQNHRADYKRWLNGKRLKTTSFELFQKYGVENCSIILVEKFPCESKEELHAREKFYIKNNECINKHIPLRTKKEYREENADKIKQYFKINAEKIKEQKQQYNKKNAIKIKENKKEYRQNKSVMLKEHKNKPFNCICGSIFRHDDKARHLRTLKHLAYIEQQHNMDN